MILFECHDCRAGQNPQAAVRSAMEVTTLGKLTLNHLDQLARRLGRSTPGGRTTVAARVLRRTYGYGRRGNPVGCRNTRTVATYVPDAIALHQQHVADHTGPPGTGKWRSTIASQLSS